MSENGRADLIEAHTADLKAHDELEARMIAAKAKFKADPSEKNHQAYNKAADALQTVRLAVRNSPVRLTPNGPNDAVATPGAVG